MHDLAAMQRFAQLGGGFGDAHAHDGVARFRRGQQVADGTDAANARGDRRHLVVRSALGELLEPTHLGDVEMRGGHAPVAIQTNGDLGVAFDAGDGIDGDLAHRGLLILRGRHHSSTSFELAVDPLVTAWPLSVSNWPAIRWSLPGRFRFANLAQMLEKFIAISLRLINVAGLFGEMTLALDLRVLQGIGPAAQLAGDTLRH